MSDELSPKARELIREARAALQPSSADRQRVRAALGARIPPSPGLESNVTAGAASAPRPLWPFLSAAGLGLGVVVVGAVLSRSEPAVAPAPMTSATVRTAAPARSTPSPEPAMDPVVPQDAVPSPRSVSAPVLSGRRAPDRLAEEVAILSLAAKELRAGRAGAALAALNDHQARFPVGLLAQERRAAKTEALCTLGRFAEARAELAKIFRASPQSPLGARARAYCRARSADFEK